MIISIPEYMYVKQAEKKLKDNFSIVDFKKAKTKLNVIVGKTRLELNEINTHGTRQKY